MTSCVDRIRGPLIQESLGESARGELSKSYHTGRSEERYQHPQRNHHGHVHPAHSGALSTNCYACFMVLFAMYFMATVSQDYDVRLCSSTTHSYSKPSKAMCGDYYIF